MAMCNVLALVLWHSFRFFNGSFTQNDLFWLLIGAALAFVVMWVLKRRGRRWF